MGELSLQVKSWSAWVPGLDQCQGWGQWSPDLIGGSAMKPDLAFIPVLVRGRLSLASRLAIRVAHDCPGSDRVASAVFCSRHGECLRTLGIFRSVVAGESVSPIQFSQSVHNTAAGIFSIERQLQIPFAAVAAGPCSGEQGFIEAVGLVRAGQGPVLWVMADDRLEAPFADFASTPAVPFGLALILGDFPGSPTLTLCGEPLEAALGPLQGTDNLLALLTGQDCLRLTGSNGWRWTWHES